MVYLEMHILLLNFSWFVTSHWKVCNVFRTGIKLVYSIEAILVTCFLENENKGGIQPEILDKEMLNVRRENELSCMSICYMVTSHAPNTYFSTEISSEWHFSRNRSTRTVEIHLLRNFTWLPVHVAWRNNICYVEFSISYLFNLAPVF